MTTPTKITLSEKELSMVTNADWILTKQVIIRKVYDLFAVNIPVIKTEILKDTTKLDEEVMSSVPKISRGENYRQLPYVMLDYPRHFHGPDIFAVRTMFWWANFFSVTLHLSGYHKKKLEGAMVRNKGLLKEGFYIGINEDQWEHHFREDNYLPFGQISNDQHDKFFRENDFIKLALHYKLDQWNDMEILLREAYKKIAALLA